MASDLMSFVVVFLSSRFSEQDRLGCTAVDLECECPYAAVGTFRDRLLHEGHVRHVGIVDMVCEFLGEQKVPICEIGVESGEHTWRGSIWSKTLTGRSTLLADRAL